MVLLLLLVTPLSAFAQSDRGMAQGAEQTNSIFDAIPSAEQQTLLRLINKERQQMGLPKVILGDSNHNAAAQLRAKELATSYSYTRPNGKSDFTVLEDFGITDISTGEAYIAGCSTPEDAMREWMQINFTRERILNEKATTVSIGRYTGGTYQNYWVLIFSYPENSCEESYQSEVLNLVNKAREKEGLCDLEMGDEALTAAAQLRAHEIAQTASHTRPNGTICFTALDDCGSTDNAVGENAAWGCVTPEEVVDAWMESPSHRENILNPEAGKMSVGYYYDASSEYGHQWIQLFAE